MAVLGSATVPIENNSYVGQTYGNILDRFDNPSYNIKLYMIDPTGEELYADPGATVVLAQTGVTGAAIDDVEIDIQYDTSNTTSQIIKWTITQPGAADFLDQIQLAKAYLGIEPKSPTVLYIEIRFQGYEAYADDEDAGGALALIAGPYRYKLQLADLQVEINETGSMYNMSGTVMATSAYSDRSYTLPKNLSTVGKTLTEHVNELEIKLNNWHSTVPGSDVPDVYKFDLSKLIGTSTAAGGGSSLDFLTDDSMLTSKDIEIEDINRLQSELWKAGSAIDRQQQLEDAPQYTGTRGEKIYDEDSIKHREGTTFDRVFATLLSMCPEFYSKVSRREDPLDPESAIKKDQANIAWFRIITKVKLLKYDKVRGTFGREITYIPILYKTPRQDVALDPKELEIDESSAKSRLGQLKSNGQLLKAYQYLFTGLNDQIVGLDIRYNPGAAILMAPAGGTIGDVSTVASNQLSTQVSEDTDLSLEGALNFFNQVKDIANKNKVSSLLDGLKDLGNNLTDSVLSSLSDATGLDSTQIQGIINDTTGQQAEQLLGALSKKQINALAADGTIQETPPAPTEDPSSTQTTDRETYTPDFSGFAYSRDILDTRTMDATVASDLVQYGYLTIETAVDALKPTQQTDASKSVKSKTSSASYKSGSARNTLFGFLVEQQNANQFLQTVDLQLRGDPWYLSGGESFEPSTEEQINYFKDVNCFWLEIRAPVTYDPVWSDEDDTTHNSGYWNYEGISRTFSAVYTIVKSKCSFSKGMFLVDVHGQRTNIDANVLKPENDGATP